MNDTFEHIEKLETSLWEAADNLRANSKLTSSDYFMPVLGVIFLRHAANRFEAAHRQIEDDQEAGRMPRRKLLPADYLKRRALWLPEQTRYDWIMHGAATSGTDLAQLVTDAMIAIEADFEPLQGVLPKDFGIFEPLPVIQTWRGGQGSAPSLGGRDQVNAAAHHDDDAHARPAGRSQPWR
jgi:type I restriction enzyme M protein